jgi:hypothetical protein
MCDEAGVELICPELNDRQPIAGLSTTEQIAAHRKAVQQSRALKDKARKSGFPDHAVITVKNDPVDPEQRENLAICLGIASQVGAGPLATLAMVCAGTGESSWKKGAAEQVYGTHVGVFQSNQIPANDLVAQCHHFLTGGKSFLTGGAIGLAKSSPSLTPGTIAARVEISDGAAAYYDSFAQEARRTIASYTGGDLSTTGVLGANADEYTTEFDFERGKPGQKETSWDCCRRLADDVGWYFFVEGGKAYFLSGDYLKRSRSRMLVKPGATGIEAVSFALDESPKKQDTITVTCRAARWQAPPGSMVDVEGYGPADDRWLVGQIQRPKLFSSNLATVTLVRPKAKKAEPHSTKATHAPTDTVNDKLVMSSGTRGWKIAPGANRPGVGQTEDMKSWLDLVASSYRELGGGLLVISTGTQHSRLSTSGNVSDHYDGNATDFGMAANGGTNLGPVGDKIAAACLMAAGYPRTTAESLAKRRGTAGFHQVGDHNGFRLQILWGFNDLALGGDHTNHVHFGIKRLPSAGGQRPT